MEELFHNLHAWVGSHPEWAYVTVFLIAMGESMAVIGVVVPGVISLIGTGALIATGAIAFWPAFIAATAGGIAGDGVSYSLGRHFNQHIRELWPFSRYPQQLEWGVAFFDRYGGWSVALGRFAGPGRAIIPLVAGMMRMPPRRFYFANVTSAAAQTLAFFIPGMIFGASLKLAAEAALRLVILGLLLVGALWFTFRLARLVYRLLAPRASTWLQELLRWADLHPNMGRIAHALADPGHPDARALTGFAFLLMLASLLVGAITGLTLFGSPESALNQAALDLAQSLHNPLGDRLMVRLAALGEPAVILPMVAVVFVWLRWQGADRHGNYWLAAAAFPLVATPVLGALLAVPRPDLGLQLFLPWSFPSGPVLLATCVYGFLAVSIARGLAERQRWAPYALATTTVAAVAAARVYLGAEWLTGIVDSIALGLVWVAALGLAFHRHSRVALRSSLFGAVALSGLIAGFVFHGWITDDRNLANLTPQRPIEILAHDAWRTTDWARLPARREDISQRDLHPLTIQYAGDPAALAVALAGAGWAPVEQLDWGNAMRLLSPSLTLAELPVIPQVHDARHEALVLGRPAGSDNREILRLWPTQFKLDDGTPLWVGNVTHQHKKVLLDLIVFPATSPEEFALPTELAGGADYLTTNTVPGARTVLIESLPAAADP
ncbi:VTT domain-containing protein [uncultured Lamprocystis sp.]|jgi:membrane protein DedA with SNARE-associated domain|uniref:VTT domain-containing protein n=1 Tax=uncultured Lamprocystis sp. TaxID=543132 RepID=UPI0025D7B8B3|nr:VTT domain-containing protein [uncultured Lamprocystis sp.]